MLDALNSIGSGLGAFFSGVAQFSVWILAAQGLLAGLMMLFYGRRSFWVFASVVGFLIGLALAASFGANLPEWVHSVLALALGIAGAALGFSLPRPMAALTGGLLLALLGAALAGGYGAAAWLQWLAAIALGLGGGYLFWKTLDWALIVGSSLLGALFVAFSLTGLFGFVGGLGLLPFTLFLAAGIFYQARDLRMAVELQRLRLGAAAASLSSSSPALVTTTAAPLSGALPGEWEAVEPPAVEQPALVTTTAAPVSAALPGEWEAVEPPVVEPPVMVTTTAAPLSAALPGEWEAVEPPAVEPPASEQPQQLK